MFRVLLQTIFYEYENKNHKINTCFVRPGLQSLGAKKLALILNFLFEYPRKAVHKTMVLVLELILWSALNSIVKNL